MSIVHTTQALMMVMVTDLSRACAPKDTDQIRRNTQILNFFFLCVQAAGETCKRRADRTLEEDCKDSRRTEGSSQQGEQVLSLLMGSSSSKQIS